MAVVITAMDILLIAITATRCTATPMHLRCICSLLLTPLTTATAGAPLIIILGDTTASTGTSMDTTDVLLKEKEVLRFLLQQQQQQH